MLIMTQNKEIINLDNVISLKIEKRYSNFNDNEFKYYIEAYTEGFSETLGKYETEEKAEEILWNIYNAKGNISLVEEV